MRVIIQGAGVVGGVTAELLRTGTPEIDVRFQDPARDMKPNGLYCDALIVATPCKDGSIDDPDFIANTRVTSRIVIRSTVTPEAVRRLQNRFPDIPVDHWPEFLTSKTAHYDALLPDKVVYGTNRVSGLDDFLYTLWGSHYLFFADGLTITTPHVSTTAKLAINSYYMLQSLFWNAVHDAANPDYQAVLKIMQADKRIEPTHTEIWADGYRGVGGFCLPKDTRTFGNLLGDRWKALFEQIFLINRDLNVEPQ